MTLLNYHKIIKDIFESTEFWKMIPQSDIINSGNLCLANIGQEYIVYSRLNYCRIQLSDGKYSVVMVNPQNGERKQLEDAQFPSWQYPIPLKDDWIFILRKKPF